MTHSRFCWRSTCLIRCSLLPSGGDKMHSNAKFAQLLESWNHNIDQFFFFWLKLQGHLCRDASAQVVYRPALTSWFPPKLPEVSVVLLFFGSIVPLKSQSLSLCAYLFQLKMCFLVFWILSSDVVMRLISTMSSFCLFSLKDENIKIPNGGKLLYLKFQLVNQDDLFIRIYGLEVD